MKLSALGACCIAMAFCTLPTAAAAAAVRVAARVAPPPAPEPSPPDTVVLLHGLGRTQLSLLPLARALERDGFHVVNLSYPWRTRTLEQLATDWLPQKIAALASPARSSSSFTLSSPGHLNPPPPSPSTPTPRLHLVTHSMGSILVRLWLEKNPPPPHLGRVVMLAPPNHGSPLADRLASFQLFHWLVGPNGPRLGTTPDSLTAHLAPWPASAAELGVLAGDRRPFPCLDRVLPPPHDGKVTVASTHLAGQRDHRTLPVSHTSIPWRHTTHTHVTTFLRTGRFPAAAIP